MANLPDFYRGDTKTYDVNFIKKGVVLDISNNLLFFTLKSKSGYTDAQAELSTSVVFPEDAESQAGRGSITLTSEDTDVSPGAYYYDFQLVNPNTIPATVTTLASGKVNVLADITRSTT